MFKKFLSVVLCLIVVMCSFVFSVSAEENEKEVDPSLWTAVDGLGRTLSQNSETVGKKQDKFVGMFYWTWHYPWINDHEAITTGSVLDKFPEAVNDFNHPAWGGTYSGRPHFWDEPLYGFYSDLDEYVLRKHAELLADADIDVVIFDCTNGTQTFDLGYEKLFEVWTEAKAEGVDVPQVAFILNFAGREDTRTQLRQLYNDVYSKGRYKDMWFMWEGKPLVMAQSRCLDIFDETDKAIYDFFTFRTNEPTYFANDTSYIADTWGWCSDYKQTLFGRRLNGSVEQMCVSVAQNANENGLTAMNNPVGTVQGRAFADGDFSYTYNYGGKKITVDKNIENAHFYGLNFQQQWDYAIEKDPEFIFVTGFNEWIAGRFDEWMGTENAFPDQFSPEYSRDIEPSKGELKDYYYYQLVENVRRFKGTSVLPESDAEKTIDINNGTAQWENVKPEYNHYTGSTKNRDSVGWKGTYYTNNTMRNDITQAKVAYDDENVYVYVKTKDNLTPSTDNAWMRLFIDTDASGISDNWEGFEFVINRNSPVDNKVTVEKSTGGWNFENAGYGDFTVNGNVLQIAVKRSVLGLDGDEVKFNFKWSDNMQENDIMDFYTNGDVAPGGRFTFVFDSTAKGEGEVSYEKEEISDFRQKLIDFYADFRKFINYVFNQL